MRFNPGARVGPFEILSPLGAGGMGEVYRARDTRLDRIVALKFLSDSILAASDPQRFQREARAISRVTHPHVCALHDIGESDGLTYLVLEFVAGDTLADRLRRGPLPIQEVLRYGIQIADALDAAHRHGVVHRDLKPANIMLTRDGVKLLDFGLAKLRSASLESVEAARTATVSLSGEGLIVGTLPYMAPEQLEAKPVDARADIFSFGAVLYEMATGARPFKGDSRISLMAAVLTDTPEPMRVRQSLTPPAFERLVQRCLEKDAENRWQTARDLASELRWIVESASETGVVAPVAARRRRSSWLLALGTGIVATAGIAGGIAAFTWPKAPVPAYTQVTFRHGVVSTARFTPDGRNVVYSASWEGQPYDVFLGHEATPDARSLGLQNGRVLSVSPIGDLAVTFGRQNMTAIAGPRVLARVPLAGGTRRDLIEGVTEADWIPGSDELAIVRVQAGKSIVEFPIGTKVHEATAAWSLRVSPDGQRVAFFEGPVRFGTSPDASIQVVDRSGTASTLSTGWAGIGLAWNRSGSEVWFTATRPNAGGTGPSVQAVSLAGHQRPIVTAPDWLVLHDISRDGRVLLARNSVRISMSCRGRDADVERDLTWIGGSGVRDLSADGQTLIFNEILSGAQSGVPSVFRRGLDGSPAIRLGLGEAHALSPDGKVVLTLRDNQWSLLPTGAGSARTLEKGPLTAMGDGAWLSDGTRIVFNGTEGQSGRWRIYIQNTQKGLPRAITPEDVGLPARAASPDGLHVLGHTDSGWALYPIDGGSARPLTSLTRDDVPVRWTADGRSLYVVSREAFSAASRDLVRIEIATGARQMVRTLAPADLVGVDFVGTPAITPDGSAYCYTYVRRLGALFIVDGLK